MTLGDLFLLVRVSETGWDEPVEGVKSFSVQTTAAAKQRRGLKCGASG